MSIKNNITRKKSYSPNINQKLLSLKTLKKSKISQCDDMSIKIKNKCYKYNTVKVKKKLLKELIASKHLDCGKFIAPKQYLSNCWFNTMFVSFFFSDKGRKFFRFLRQLMITGEKIDGSKIPNELHMVFFQFNLFIEACYNQTRNNFKNNNLLKKYNSNTLIAILYKILKKNNIYVYNVDEPGNALYYYSKLIQYLHYNPLCILKIPVSGNTCDNKYIQNQFMNNNINIENIKLDNTTPEIIIIELIDNISNGVKDKPVNISLTDNNNNINNYILDSAIVRDTTQNHVCSLLTCNKVEKKFDGASYSRLSNFKWKHLINKNKHWTFKGVKLEWNFMNSYQILFYYKV